MKNNSSIKSKNRNSRHSRPSEGFSNYDQGLEDQDYFDSEEEKEALANKARMNKSQKSQKSSEKELQKQKGSGKDSSVKDSYGWTDDYDSGLQESRVKNSQIDRQSNKSKQKKQMRQS